MSDAHDSPVTRAARDDAATPPVLSIDVVSDVVCPWCFIGKRRLEAALAARDPALPVLVRWHPFELNPDLPRDGIDRRTYLERKFGGAAHADARYDRVQSAGEDAGIAFAFDRIARQPNTRDAHRLIWWAEAQGADASPLVERLFAAYFQEGRPVHGVAALAALAAEVGLDAAAARAFLATDEGVDAIEAAEQRAYALGISGVPFFIFARQLAVSGAQPAAVLAQAIAEAAALRGVVAEPATS